VTDLYAALGIERTADLATVRAAYRRASKKAHPDMPGGSETRFALVKLAHDTLTDDKRRRHYDETGEAEQNPVDNEASAALACLASALESVIGECAQIGRDPATVNLLEGMRIWIRKSLAAEAKQRPDLERMLATNEDLRARFSEGVMRQLLDARARNMRVRLDQIARNAHTGTAALALLHDVTFDHKPVATPHLTLAQFPGLANRL